MAINDEENYPISDTEAAELKQEATKRLSDLPAQLRQMCVGSTWRRSAEQSMMEYQLLGMAAQSIEILKAMKITGKEQLQREAERERQEAAPGVLKAIKLSSIEYVRRRWQRQETTCETCGSAAATVVGWKNARGIQ